MSTIVEKIEIAEEINGTEETGGFVFFRSFKESVESLPYEQGNKLLRALMKYGIDGIIVDDDPFIRALVVAMKPNIDNSHKQFKKAQERKKKWAKKNGKKDNTDDSSESTDESNNSSPAVSIEETRRNRKELLEKLVAGVNDTVEQKLQEFAKSLNNNQQSQYIR